MKIQVHVATKSLKVAELLAIGCFEGEKNLSVKTPSLDAASRVKVQHLLAQKKFSGKTGETLLIPAAFVKGGGSLLVIGLGKKEKWNLERVRRAAARLLSQATSLKNNRVCFDLESFSEKNSLAEIAGAAVEGARLSSYRFEKYKSKPKPALDVEEFGLILGDSRMLKHVTSAVKEAEIVSEGVFFTRNLANEPPNVMTPDHLAESIRQMAVKNNLNCRILKKRDIAKLKMGGILGVSQGSAQEPRFVILENRPRSGKSVQPIVLVGKGITFDTGGISIKPSNDMDKMKFDMCGAAAVAGAMKVIANLNLPVRVVGLTPICENMPGGNAQRPGDIVRCLNGKTVEVLNTDAEGRLILADALSYAARYKPKALIDAATLTGACAATFSDLATGLLGTDPDLVQRIKEAGERSGERCWELPLWDEYFDLIKATYADIQNVSKKYAGTITAAMFLKEFADHTDSWAHLDIAGTAWNEAAPKPLSPIGATGVGVRLFVELVKSYL